MPLESSTMGSPPFKVLGLVLAPHWEQAAPKSGLWMAGPDQLQSLSGGVVLVGGADGPGRHGFPILAPVFALLTCWVWGRNFPLSLAPLLCCLLWLCDVPCF